MEDIAREQAGVTYLSWCIVIWYFKQFQQLFLKQ